jgi:hypothetical protein
VVETHDLWHIAVLGSTLMAAAGVALLALSPLIFEERPPGLAKGRALVIGLVILAAILLAVEWLGIH